MERIKQFIINRLNDRQQQSSFRSLKYGSDLVDFCSNDYLGFARSKGLRNELIEKLSDNNPFLIGSTGSRLISGNEEFTEELESDIATFHLAEAALLYNSGYDANLGIFSSLPQRGDTIILDELVHASIIDGARLSHAKRFSFVHNDLESLESKLKKAEGKIYIGVESIYSMDGDTAPLNGIYDLAQRYDAALIVDEAHAVGVFGPNGRGLVVESGLEDQVLARVITFGKALGCHGAAIVGNKNLRDYLINFSRSFIYTTAAPYLTHLSVALAYKKLASMNTGVIHRKIDYFKSQLTGISDKFIKSDSAIQCLMIPGNTQAKHLADELQKRGVDVRAILHPTVAAGKERLRICLHSFNTELEISHLCSSLINAL